MDPAPAREITFFIASCEIFPNAFDMSIDAKQKLFLLLLASLILAWRTKLFSKAPSNGRNPFWAWLRTLCTRIQFRTRFERQLEKSLAMVEHKEMGRQSLRESPHLFFGMKTVFDSFQESGSLWNFRQILKMQANVLASGSEDFQ